MTIYRHANEVGGISQGHRQRTAFYLITADSGRPSFSEQGDS